MDALESVPTDPVTPEAVYLEAARHALDKQIETHRDLDTKVAQFLSVGSVVLPGTFALLNLGGDTVPRLAEWTLGLALLCYVGLLFSAAQASLVRGLENRPNLTTLRRHSKTYAGTSSPAGSWTSTRLRDVRMPI